MKWAIKKNGRWFSFSVFAEDWASSERTLWNETKDEDVARLALEQNPDSVLVRILSREESAAEKKGLRAEVKELSDCASRLADSLESYNETSGDAESVDTIDQYRDTGAQVDAARALLERVGGGR